MNSSKQKSSNRKNKVCVQVFWLGKTWELGKTPQNTKKLKKKKKLKNTLVQKVDDSALEPGWYWQD